MIEQARPYRLIWLSAALLLALSLFSMPTGTALAQGRPGSSPAHSVIPLPASVEMAASGAFSVTSSTAILAEPGNAEAARVGRFLAGLIGNTVESTPRVRPAGTTIPAGSILLTTQGAPASLGEEGYDLTVTQERVTLLARTPAGLFYGVQTLRQLLPPGVEYTAALTRTMQIPALRIVDRPRFGWRGAMLDVARHFFGVEDVKRYVDLLALYKINRLHLHLSDDQGWRIEIPSWPRLTTYGGGSEAGGGAGGFYTREDFAEIVRYAADRFITIVPEIDLPGHTYAALASYPELACDNRPVAPGLAARPTAPYGGIEVGFSYVCVEEDSTYQFVSDVVREISEVSPGPYFHIGGDEVHQLEQEQYNRFIERAQEIVQAHGKRAVGWDEIAHARLLPDVIVQHWRPEGSQAGIAEAISRGASVILSPADHVYLDMKYDSTTVLGLAWAGLNPVRDAYEWDPARRLPGVSEQAILGVEAPLWSETLGTLSDVEFMAFPRLPGVAEIGWSPAAGRGWDEYRHRLAAHAPRWTALGVTFFRSPDVPWED